MGDDAARLLGRMLADGDGILRLEPTWVARDFLPPLKSRRVRMSPLSGNMKD